MSVRVTNFVPSILLNKQSKTQIFLREILDGIDLASQPSTPKRHGDLVRNKLKQVLGPHAKIVWLQRYAVYQETKQHQNYTTPGTGPHFAERAVRSQVAKSVDYARKVGLI